MTRTGFVVHERYSWHDTGTAALLAPPGRWVEPDWPHGESASSGRRLRSLVDAADLLPHLTQIRPEPAAEEDLLRFHTRDHVDRVRTLSEGAGGDAGLLAPVGRGSHPIALLSLGGVFAAADGPAAGELDTAYALTRPPGHHALPDQGTGSCLFEHLDLLRQRGPGGSELTRARGTGPVDRVDGTLCGPASCPVDRAS